MLHNPSHLEAVSPVANGKAKAKQDNIHQTKQDTDSQKKVLSVHLHGDAAFTG